MSHYDALLKAASAKYGVPLNLLTAQMQTESAGNPLAVSSAGAQGLMQIMPPNFRPYGVTNPYDPAQSIDAGAHLDADNYKATGNWPDALRMYHGGTDKANWGPKTQAYEGKIMGQVMPSFGAFDGSMAQPAANLPSFDDFNSALSGGAKKAQSPQSSPPAQVPSFQDMDAQMNAPAPAQPNFLQRLGSGIEQGVHDVIDKPAEKLAGYADSLGITPMIQRGATALGLNGQAIAPTQAQQTQADQANAQNFEDNYGGSGWSTAGRVGGQILATAPLIETGAGVLTGGLRAAGSALGDTAIGNGLSGISRLLDGTAGANASGVPRLLAKGASLATRGAAAGAAFNGLTGADPLTGAEWGAAGAPIAGVAGKAASVVAAPVVRAVGNAITDLSPEWTANAAANKLTGAMMADGITPQAVAEQMRMMGPQATPIDAVSALMGARSGGNLRNLAEVAANSPGEGQALANQTFGARTEGAPARINEAIKAATGATGNIHAEAADLMAQRAAAARPLYEKALSGDLPVDPRLQGFLQDPVFQQGLGHGQEIARLESLAKGEPFNPADYASLKGTLGTQTPSSLVDANGQPLSVTATPSTPGSISMRAADAAKRGLDDLLEQYRDSTTGRLSLDQRGRALNDVRNSFVDYLDQANPDYAAARAAWAGPSSSLDALAMGRKALTNDAEVTASNVARMSPSDRQFFLSGVTRALQDKIAAAQDGADATRKIFGNDLIRNRIAAAFDDPEAFAQFEQQMNNEAQFAATKNAVLSNSATARRMAGQADQGDIYGPLLGAAKSIVTGNPAGAASNAAQASGAIRNALIQPSARQLAAQSRLLFTQNPDEFAAAFQKKPGALRNFLTGGR